MRAKPQPIGELVPIGENLGHQTFAHACQRARELRLGEPGEGCRAAAAEPRRRPLTNPAAPKRRSPRRRQILPMPCLSRRAQTATGSWLLAGFPHTSTFLRGHLVLPSPSKMAGAKRFVYVLANAHVEPHFYVGLTADVNARLADQCRPLSSATMAASCRN
jgi:hypothetical protein